jgi:hypothetical protein
MSNKQTQGDAHRTPEKPVATNDKGTSDGMEVAQMPEKTRKLNLDMEQRIRELEDALQNREIEKSAHDTMKP